MTKAIIVRDAAVPQTLVVLRMGTNTLSDNALTQACERAHAAMGLHAFSVFEIPNLDYAELARLEPILITRPKILEASGPELVAAGFALLPTGRFPHWSVVVSEPTSEQFARVRSHFRGPIDNPAWTGRGR